MASIIDHLGHIDILTYEILQTTSVLHQFLSSLHVIPYLNNSLKSEVKC